MDVLNIKFECSDLNREVTIREYLIELLSTLWDEGDGFSGKRPFGNSGWQYDLYEALIKNQVLQGTLDEDGHVDAFDGKEAHKLVAALIKKLGEVPND